LNNQEHSPLIAAVEAGGTKMVCAVGSNPDDLEETRFATTTPDQTLGEAISFFKSAQKRRGQIQALGIGTFGPADINVQSSTFGFITNTPKEHWSNTDIVSPLRSALGDIPLAFETDVNAAAWGERKWGAARGLDDFIYITVGTGIGGGAVSGGRILHGKGHPEMGHLRIPHDTQRDPFPGSCPFHSDCLEGLASGTALAKRWNCNPGDLEETHQGWDLEACYLADALANLTLTLCPARFILGGGVMEQAHLFDKVRNRLSRRLAGYVSLPELEKFIVPPGLGAQAGILGAMALAQDLILTIPPRP
jgi:fructokinase